MKNSHLRPKKKERLLLENFDDKKSQEYKSRHLNDTRYISRLLVQHIDKTIRPEDQKYGYVKTIPGQATSVLRKLWGFHDKDRAKSHKHHAFDAILIAGAGSKIKAWEKGITNALKYRYQADKGLSLGEKAQRNIERFGLHIDLPWEGFAEDARRYMENVFVSRMGKRKVTGEMHAQTILSRQFLSTEERIVKTINLQSLGKKEEDVIKHLNKMVDISFENGEVLGRSSNVYKVILDHAKEYEWDMDKAFTQENAPQMPVKKDNPTHIPKIRKIKIYSSASSKIHPFNSMKSDKRQSAVDSGDVIRLDLFRDSKGKFEAVPVYPFHYKELPTPSDDKAEFMFSIYKNDYLSFEADKEFSNGCEDSKLLLKVKNIEGYYSSRNTGKMKLRKHDHQDLYVIAYSSMKKITKYYIDILGNKHFVASTDQPEEKRLTLKEVKSKWEENNKRNKGSK